MRAAAALPLFFLHSVNHGARLIATMTRPTLPSQLLISSALFLIGAAPALAATVTDIRIAAHADHVRVVLDIDAAVTFTIADDGNLDLKGLEGENAVLNATPSEAPLKRVVLAPGKDAAHLTFETATPITARAFLLHPDKEGGNRLVVDLYPKNAKASSDAATPAPQADPPSTERSADAPATGTTSAVAAAAVEALPMPLVAARPAMAESEAAVPSMPPEAAIGGPSPLSPRLMTAAPAPPTFASANATNTGPGYSDEELRAERALDRGDIKDACTRADDLIKANPNDLRGLIVQGACHLAQHDGTGAKAAYTAALEIDPSFDRARVGLATADDMLGDHAGARAELSSVLGHDVPAEDLARLIDAFKQLPAAQNAAKPVTAATN